MDKKKSVINVFSGIFFKLCLLVVTLFSRQYLIKAIGNDANGVISLFSSIIGVLSVTELGVGSAISFSMYEPIVNNDTNKISALYFLYKKWYRIIGSVVLVGGVLVIPALPTLAKGYNLQYSVSYSYMLQLLGVCISYAYSANVSLINAFKNNYVTTTVSSVTTILTKFLQIVLVYFFHSFYLYLTVGILTEVLHLLLLKVYVLRNYGHIINNRQVVDDSTRQSVNKNIKAIFFHKIGHMVVNTIDSIVISTIMGVAILGKYSNYIVIVNALLGVITLVFSQLVSIVGNAFYQQHSSHFKSSFKFMYLINYASGFFIFLCFDGCASPFISSFFGSNLTMSREVVLTITINYFIQFMEQDVRLFKDATGQFYYDRYKCLFEAALNLFLSILFAYYIGVTGVIIATIITNLFICHTVEPYVLYKHTFNESPLRYYISNYFLIGLFVCILFIYDSLCMKVGTNYHLQFIFNGLMGLFFSFPILLILVINVFSKFKVIQKRKE